MRKVGTELKVGIFVLIGLVFGAGLVIQFNKSAGPLTKTYRVYMKAKDVSGVIPGSFVLMAGVRIGSVKEIQLEDETGNVTMIAQLRSQYRLLKDSQFLIRQSGFLGDQYIGVFQGKDKKAGYLQDGDQVVCEEPFDLGEVARSTGGLVKRVDTMVGQLSNAVARVDTTLLAQESLTNLTTIISNFRLVSERTLTTLQKVEALVDTNSPVLSDTLTNAKAFSLEINGLARDLRETLATNRLQLTQSLKNIELATAKLDDTMSELNSGKGVAGALIKNEQLAIEMSLIVSNLQVLSSNINTKGLWGVLRKPKVPAKNK